MDNVTITTTTIPGGEAGAAATLDRMRSLVNESLSTLDVIETARYVVRGVGGFDVTAQAQAIRDWLAARFRFVRDPCGIEYLQSPVVQLQSITRQGVSYGDCDDAAILGAALGKAVGISAAFEAVAFVDPARPLSHVYALLLLPGGGIMSLDVTKPRGANTPIARKVRVAV